MTISKHSYLTFMTKTVMLILKLPNATHSSFDDSVGQDQTAQNVQSGLRSALSDKVVFFSQNITLKYQNCGFYHRFELFIKTPSYL